MVRLPTGSTSVLDRPRPKTPDMNIASSSFAPPPPSTSTASSNSKIDELPPRSTSVLDRPRPKTPEFDRWDYSSRAPVQSISPGMTTSASSSSARSSSGGGLAHSNSELSFTSAEDLFAGLEREPPKLVLDFSLDSSSTMFGLSGLLNIGSVAEDGEGEGEGERTPQPSDERSPFTFSPPASSFRSSVSTRTDHSSDGSLAMSVKYRKEAKNNERRAKPRRRSLASMLSFSSSDHGASISRSPTSPNDAYEGISRTKDSSDSLHSSVTSGSAIISPSPSSSHLSKSSSTPSFTLAPSQPLSLDSHATGSLTLVSSTSGSRPPMIYTQSSERTLSIDKSLPPTPSTPTSKTDFYSSPLTEIPKTTMTTTTTTNQSGSATSRIVRQLSKLRSSNGNASSSTTSMSTSTSASTSTPRSSSTSTPTPTTNGNRGFQLISATTTRKQSLFSSGGGAATIGRRFAERFTSRGSNAPSFTASDESVAAAPHGPARPRRGSLGNLLSSASEGKKGVTSVLGMSLPGGRKSADMLSTSARPVTDERSRRSLDLLSESKGYRRRSDTASVLNITTTQLSSTPIGSSVSSPQAERNISPSASTPESTSSVPSPTAMDTHSSPEKAAVTVATRIHRADSISGSGDEDGSTVTSRIVASPILVRSDSLRRGEKGSPVVLPEGYSAIVGPSSVLSSSSSPSIPTTAEHTSTARRKRTKLQDSGVGSDASMSSAWLDLEDALTSYSSAVAENRIDRAHIISNVLLPFLRREEDDNASSISHLNLAQRQRHILFQWLATLTQELRELQPTHRGACLEAVAAIAESHIMSPSALERDHAGQALYRSAIVNVVSFAVEKLNDKAVYANTLVFSGRILALAFFRIEGVALKLLRALPAVKRQYVRRILEESNVDENRLPPVKLQLYPPHLWHLCLRELKAYTALLMPMLSKPQSTEDRYLVQDGDTSVEMSGNWLIRWTASDSDLPFAFYRAYHRQLAAHLVPPETRDNLAFLTPMDPSIVLMGPGALFIAASLLEKSDALVHRNLRSVTSIGPNNANFNTNDSANLNFGQKPKVLELANRRLVSTMLDIVGGPPPAPGEGSEVVPDAETRRHTFSKMLQVWIRASVKRTSMWDTRSVFILLDLIEGLIYTLSYPAPTMRESEEEVVVPKPHMSCVEMFDIPFIFSFIKIILTQADNTVAIMRTVAFIYAHFEIFTLRPSDRDELCERIILNEEVFSRLYLHWNAGVRGYFIRLLVWRLARLGIVDQEQHPDRPRDPRILEIFSILNVHLEAIRKRHDELEPLDNLTDDDPFKPKRSTICSTRGVKEMPFTVDELRLEESDDETDEPQELVRGSTGQSNGKKPGLKEVVTVAKVVSWLKGGLSGKSKQSKAMRGNLPEARIQPFLLDEAARAADEEDTFDRLDTSISTNETPDSLEPVLPLRMENNIVPSGLSERRLSRSVTPAFFSFEFEGGMAPTEPTDANDSSSSSSSSPSSDTAFPLVSPRRAGDISVVPSPRVSARFSKRISILPPAALDVLKESGEAVPPIPKKYLKEMESYDKRLHPYAVRGLRDYEDALDEWTDWVARLQEEEDDGKKHNKGFMDVVPRLSVAWPSSFEDGP